MSKWAAIIGSPVGHSLSPILHKKAYEILGLPWEYYKFDVDLEELPSFLAALEDPSNGGRGGDKPGDDTLPVRGTGTDNALLPEVLQEGECVGLSVTAPLKRAIMDEVDAVDGLAKLVSSANTIVFGRPLTAAFNTDIHGIVETLRPHVSTPEREEDDAHVYTGPTLHTPAGQSANIYFDDEEGGVPVVFGTGATASSAMAALKTLGFSRVYLAGRQFAGPDNAFMRALEVGLEVRTIPLKNEVALKKVVAQAPVMISTIPPHAAADIAGDLKAAPGAVLLDVTYQKGKSAFAPVVEAADGVVTSPLEMLVHQGLAQIKLMTNREVPYEPIYEAVCEAAGAC